MTTDFTLGELSELFAVIGAELAVEDDSGAVLRRVTEFATHAVPGADHAGITIGRDGAPFSTVAATDDLVSRIDALQYELGTGPCVDAIVDNTRYNAPDLSVDQRWPEFGRRAVETTGVFSMLSLRMFVETDGGLIAGLNMYSHRPHAFDESSETIALLLATHGSLATAKAQAQQTAQDLVIALKNSREIGVAMGIVMAYQKVTRDQAFDLLRIASQHTHRKLSQIATEVADTGALPSVPTSRRPMARSNDGRHARPGTA
jgi:GAF domain-containing protein